VRGMPFQLINVGVSTQLHLCLNQRIEILVKLPLI
jgi:hypothetical protein